MKRGKRLAVGGGRCELLYALAISKFGGPAKAQGGPVPGGKRVRRACCARSAGAKINRKQLDLNPFGEYEKWLPCT